MSVALNVDAEEEFERLIEAILAEWDDLETVEDTENLDLAARFAGPTSPLALARARRTFQIDRAHVPDDGTSQSEKMFARLIAQAVCGAQGSGVLVTGPSGSGKSHILDRLRRLSRFRPFESATGEGVVRPLVYVEAPAPCTLKALGIAIFEKMTGQTLKATGREYDIWARVRAQLQAHRTTILIIDEMHHVLINKGETEKNKVAETFKNVMQSDAKVFLVLGGMPEAKTFWETQPQLRRRTRLLEIRPLPNDADGYELIANYVDELTPKLGFKTAFSLSEGDLPHRLHVASRGYTGTVACIVKSAAEMAVDAGDPTITIEHLADAFEAMYGLPDKENPFRVDDFLEIKTPEMQNLQKRSEKVEGSEQKGRKTRLRGKGDGDESAAG